MARFENPSVKPRAGGDVAEGVECLPSRSRSLESGREEEGQAESEADGRGREGEGGWAGTEIDVHSGLTRGSLEKNDCLSLTESCHTW